MSYRDRLIAEINAKLDDMISNKMTLRANWIAHAICIEHEAGLVDGEEKEFWLHCGYAETRDQVRRCINKRAGDKTDNGSQQATLPGFDHLQLYYMVNRNGEEIGVPVHDLTEEEIDIKGAHYRSMGLACYAHADELDRFKRERIQPPLFEAADKTNAVG